MILDPKIKNKINLEEIEMGDLVRTEYGWRILVWDNYKYALMDLDRKIKTNWLNDKRELLECFEITEFIKSNNLKIIFNR